MNTNQERIEALKREVAQLEKSGEAAPAPVAVQASREPAKITMAIGDLNAPDRGVVFQGELSSGPIQIGIGDAFVMVNREMLLATLRIYAG